MFVLVRYTDKDESYYAAIIRVCGQRPPLKSWLKRGRPDAVWNLLGSRAQAVGSNENPNEVIYFGIEQVDSIDGYTL